MPENPMTAGTGGNGAGLPGGLNFPSFSPFGGLPLDPSHQRGHAQNVWESHAAAAAARFHALHGLSVSGSTPSLSELSFLAGRRSGEGGILGTPTPGITGSAAELHAAAAAAYSRLASPYMDPLYTGLHTSPTASLRLSPIDPRGSAGLGMPPDYMSVAASGFCPRGLADLHPGASTLSSAELAFAFDNARFASPRASVNARANRKRALSCSPYSDSFDLNSMIRFSPNSLVSLVNGSRGSSAASGSYGHLSAGTMSPAMGMAGLSAGFSGSMPPLQQLQAHLLRSGPLAGSLPGSPFLPHGMYNSPFSAHQSLYMPSLQHSLNIKQEGESAPKASPGVGAVSSTMEVDEHRGPTRKMKIRREPATTTCGLNGDDRMDTDRMKDEPEDFIETNCHWTGCSMEFCTQEELVTHINTDHIHANKKVFICRWKDCSREEKPFKAQYMLVVHMRRHTGEKPHRCTFEGCLKAYSRLENLKTHLRSHTGEKPYTCEYPGCVKAFSNASDRAKHQNRTHSNEKPYVCKAPGCTKRYTDPSSLRKHVKTVHGAEFYASKKHKGNDHGNEGNDKNKGNGHNGNAESPRSEDMGSKTTSVSSPSIKSEDPNSPHQQSSPGGDSSGTEINGGVEPMEEPISDNNVSTTNEMSDCASVYDNSPMTMQQQQQQQQCWDLKENEAVIPPEMMDIGVGVGLAVGGGGGHHPDGMYNGGGGGFHDPRRAFRGRLGAKGFGYQGPGPAMMPSMVDMHGHGPRRNLGIDNLNRRINDLKMEGSPSANNNCSMSGSAQVKPPGSDLSPRLPNAHMQTTLKAPSEQANTATRRDSGNSTLSSYYSSMRSDGGQNSRRSSALSQTSNQNAVAGGYSGQNRQAVNSSPYDPISPGSSRRSSALESEHSMAEQNPLNSLASSSNTLTLTSSLQAQAHLERLHRRALGIEESKDKEGSQQTLTSSGNYLIQTQNAAARMDASWMGGMNVSMMMRNSANMSGELRRMSDPCTSMNMSNSGRIILPHQVPHQMQMQMQMQMQRSQQQQNGSTYYPHQGSAGAPPTTNPNVEASMGEDFLIPDDMANYLSECQGQRFGYPNNHDPTRPSTCPPPNTVAAYQHQNQNLPPPPPYNQAVSGHHQGFPQFPGQIQQNNVRKPPNNPAAQAYPTQSPINPYSPAPSCQFNVQSPYNQPVNSPAFSQHSVSVMSPKQPVASPCMPHPPNPSPRNTNVNMNQQPLLPPQQIPHANNTQTQQQQLSTPPQPHGQAYPYANNAGPPTQQQRFYPMQSQQQNQRAQNNHNSYAGQNGGLHNYSQMYPQNHSSTTMNSTCQPQSYPQTFPQGQTSNGGMTQPQPHNPMQYPTNPQMVARPHPVQMGNAQQPQPQAQPPQIPIQAQCEFNANHPHWNGNTDPRFYNGTNNATTAPWPNNGVNFHQTQVPPTPNLTTPNHPGRKHGKMSGAIQCKSVTSQSKQQQQQQQQIAGQQGQDPNQRPAMRPEAYQRTLEYVQQCQQQMWVNKDSPNGSDHSNPLSPDSTTDPQQKSPAKPNPAGYPTGLNVNVLQNS